MIQGDRQIFLGRGFHNLGVQVATHRASDGRAPETGLLKMATVVALVVIPTATFQYKKISELFTTR